MVVARTLQLQVHGNPSRRRISFKQRFWVRTLRLRENARIRIYGIRLRLLRTLILSKQRLGEFYFSNSDVAGYEKKEPAFSHTFFWICTNPMPKRAASPRTDTLCHAKLPHCVGPNLGFLKFKVLKLRKTRAGDLSVRFQLTVPCCLSSTEPTFVTFLGLTKSKPFTVNAKHVKVKGNIITGKARLVARQTYLINSYTFNPDEPLRFTAGAGSQLVALQARD